MKDHTANTVAVVLSEFCLLFAIPKIILTDQGTEFCSDIMNNLAKELKIRKIMCTPYHPESNGALERTHGTIKSYLKAYVNKEKNDWDVFLPFACSWYNKSWHESLGYSPFEILYGFKRPLPIEPEEGKTIDQYIYERQITLRQHYTSARERQIMKKEKTKKQFDKDAEPIYYKEGDKVLIKNMATTSKLQAKFKGPFTVVSTKGNNVELLMEGDRVKRYHTKLLKPYWSTISIIWMFIWIGLLSLACGSMVQPLNKSTSVFFHQMGKAYTHIDNWNILTSFNLTKIQDKITSLKGYEPTFNQLEPVVVRANVKNFDTTILMDIKHIEEQFLLEAVSV